MTNQSRQAGLDALSAAAKSARDYAEDVLGCPLQFRLDWSNRLTKSAGVAVKPAAGRPIVRLSSPIFVKALDEVGVVAACEQVRVTTLHEIGHIVTDVGHGGAWRRTMRLLGLDPDEVRYHDMTCGLALSGKVAREAAAEYPVGTLVEYQAKGRQFVGTVKRHSAKTLTVANEAELIGGFWEDTTKGRWWCIPWSRVGDAIVEIIE